MKSEKKEAARKLRGRGFSINEIQKRLGVSKGSVSLWVRDVKLTEAQKTHLSKKGLKIAVIEKRRATRLKNEDARREKVLRYAKKEIPQITKRDLWLIGAILYWAEGAKRSRNVVQFSNSDPDMIKIIMSFFRDICDVPNTKFRCRLHIHPHLDHKQAKGYWSSVSNVPLQQFYKTYRKRTRAGKHTRDNLPFGTLDIFICDTTLLLRIKGWVQGIFQNATN